MKYALVTGGSRGLGKAISIKLSQMGIPVIINYKDNNTINSIIIIINKK